MDPLQQAIADLKAKLAQLEQQAQQAAASGEVLVSDAIKLAQQKVQEALYWLGQHIESAGKQ